MSYVTYRSPLSVRSISTVVFATVVTVGLSACGKKDTGPIQVPTVVVEEQDIQLTTEATGTVEPVDTVAVKSQASGMIMKMPVEVGTYVKPGDLIAEIDTRNLTNDFQRTAAAAQAAESTIVVQRSALERASRLFKDGIITRVEYEAAVLNNANAQSALVAAQTNLSVAERNLEFARVRAEISGTIINKDASVGSVVSSAVSNVGGGSTIVTIADLSRVRMRVLVNETDIASVKVGQDASVTVDALPNRTFRGRVEKIEPKAVVQQSVTMFPVLVSLDNPEQTLLPGMNGEVSMIIQQRRNVIAVPIDALRSRAEISSIGVALGIQADSLDSMLAALQTQPMRTGGGDSVAAQAGRGQSDGTRAGQGQGDASQAGQSAMGGARPDSGARRMRRDSGGGAGGAGRGVGRSGRTQALFVFVKQGAGFVPRRVQVGITNFDYAEVLSGVNSGDEVALLSMVAAQAERDQRTAQVRNMSGGAIPGGPRR